MVIPVHSPQPSAYELISFHQCFTILSERDIKIVAPEGLSLESYQKVVPNFEIIYINPKWQSNLMAYNKLKISRFFYNLFKDYQFLLTYELDAFIFKDELDYWCDKNYDYIGAPWFEGFDNAKPGAELIKVGNSGFSLRKIHPILKVLKKLYYKKYADFGTGRKNLLKAYLKAPFLWLINQLDENYTVQNSGLYEDRFFCDVVPAFSKEFKIAPISEAISFSFELHPRTLFELNNDKLPMGCHAWWRYDLAFWRPYIENEGYTL